MQPNANRGKHNVWCCTGDWQVTGLAVLEYSAHLLVSTQVCHAVASDRRTAAWDDMATSALIHLVPMRLMIQRDAYLGTRAVTLPKAHLRSEGASW